MKKIILFGDSIIKGVTFNGSAYHLCPDHDLPQLTARGIEVENHTKMGATIEDGLKSMERYLHSCDSQTTVLLGYGGNDCDYDWQAISDAPEGEHQPRVAPQTFVEGLRKAIRRAQDAGDGLAPFVRTHLLSPSFPLKWRKFRFHSGYFLFDIASCCRILAV